MSGLTIRNLNDELLEWLRDRAATNQRTLNAEVIDILFVARGDELAATMTGPLAATAPKARALGVRTRRSGALVRADRDRHTR